MRCCETFTKLLSVVRCNCLKLCFEHVFNSFFTSFQFLIFRYQTKQQTNKSIITSCCRISTAFACTTSVEGICNFPWCKKFAVGIRNLEENLGRLNFPSQPTSFSWPRSQHYFFFFRRVSRGSDCKIQSQNIQNIWTLLSKNWFPGFPGFSDHLIFKRTRRISGRFPEKWPHASFLISCKWWYSVLECANIFWK